jgi:hypothetical protein
VTRRGGWRNRIAICGYCQLRLHHVCGVSTANHVHGVCLCLAYNRCVYSYFMGVPVVDLPFKELLTHHIYELSPGTVLFSTC